MQAELIVGGVHYPIRGTMRIGRSSSSDLVLRDPMVSSDHAAVMLVGDGGKVFIEHRRGRNGTFVNGDRVDGTAELAHGDEIMLGRTLLRFVVSDSHDVDVSDIELVVDSASPSIRGGSDSGVGLLSWSQTPADERRKNYSRLHAAYLLGRTLELEQDIEHIYRRTVDAAFDVFEPDRVVIFSYERESRQLIARWARARRHGESPIRISRTFLQAALKEPGGVASGSAMCVPMFVRQQCVGAVYVDCRECTPFQSSDIETLYSFAIQAAAAIGYWKAKEEALDHQRTEAHRERLALLGRLTASIAHELKNPATYLLANISYVRDGFKAEGNEELRAALNDALDACSRIQRLAADLNNFSRRDTADMERVDVAAVIARAIGMAEPQTRANARIRTEIAPGLPEAHAASARLHQVILNLIINASHALESSRQGNEIVVSAGQDGQSRVYIEVSDNGPGITPEDLEHIFEPFFTTKSSGQGTGLGLSISRDIITAFGGTIEATSDLGKGATFRIVLEQAPESEPSGDATLTRRIPNMRALRKAYKADSNV